MPTDTESTESRGLPYDVLFEDASQDYTTPLPTPNDIESGEIIPDREWGANVVKIQQRFIMKFGRDVRPIEANNMLYVAKHTTKPLRQLKHPEYFGTIHGGPPNIHLFMQDDITGPLKSEREFVDAIIRSYAIELGPRGAQKVRKSIMVLDNGSLVIIDWEYASWSPVYCEYFVAMFCRLAWTHDWHETTMDPDTEKARGEEPNPEQPKPSADFPDGGLKAWSVVVGAFFGLFVSFGWTNCVGLFQGYYEANQLRDLSPSNVSWIPALSMFMMFITGPFVGRAFDNFGPHYLLFTGTLLHVFGLMMASISSEYYQFILSQAICSPLGAAMVLYPSFSCVTTWFRQKRALALGITASGSSLGGTILPIVVNRLIPRIGFGWTLRVCAFLLFGLLVVTNLTVRSRIAPQPKEAGIVAYLRPFTSLSFVLTSLAGFFYSMGMFIPITFMVTYGEHVGLSNNMAGYLVSIFNASSNSGIGRILPGYIADKVGSFNVSIAAATLSTIFMLALWLPGHSHESAIAFAALFGFSSGTYTAISPALVAHISNLEEIGTRSGTMYAFMSVAALTGSPIGGALISSADGSYWKLQLFAGCMLGAGTALYVAARLYIIHVYTEKTLSMAITTGA
ncbi:monocarboxylate permease-like protein [Fusarium oxysporum f. sp. phaseoli]